MWFTKFFTAVMVALSGLLPSSCTKAKNPAAQSLTPAATLAAAASGSSTNKDLGTLEMTNHYETCVNLGAGRSCTIRPNRLDRASLQLTFSLESKDADGKVKDFSVVQVVGKKGKSIEVAVGSMNLTLIPLLAE